MKLVKSLLLGSAAGLMAVAGAQAADLPVRKAAPVVDYVRVCSAYGTGFFFIPGTETCLRISGRVRAEYLVGETYDRNRESAFNWRARGQINLDARTQTAYGTLRTFIRAEANRNVGSYYGNLPGSNTLSFANGSNDAFRLNKAFIQFAGITAGRSTSFFDFYAGAIIWGSSGGSDTYGNDPIVLAYTANFGSGISATIALEDPSARRVGGATTTTVLGNPNVFATFPLVYDQDQRPHLVGQLAINQAWGTAQLSAAAYQIRAANVFVPFNFAAGVAGPASSAQYADTEYGFAIQGGLKINLPMIAAGDQLWLQAAYTNGNLSYINPSATGFGRFSVGSADAVFDQTGELERTRGFSLTAAFLHYWTPQIRQGLYANWTSVDVSNSVAARPVAGVFFGQNVFASGALVDFNLYELGTNLIWSPVSGLDIGVEGIYEKVDPRGRTFNAENIAGGPVRTIASDDRFQARLRIQRDF